MVMKKSFLVLLGVLALSACGNSKNDAPGFQQVGLNQGGGLPPVQGYCAPEVVDAYNNFTNQCNSIDTGLGAQPCRFSAEAFLRLYANISCVAVPPSSNGFGNQWGGNPYLGQYQGQQIFHITDFPMRQVLEVLDAQLGGNSGWRQQHRRWPRVGHRGGYPQGQPGQGYPGQQPYPGKNYPGQQYPGQQYPGPQY
jgi:hypothetical protein